MIELTEHDEAEYQRVRAAHSAVRREAWRRFFAVGVPPSRHDGPGAIDPPGGSLPVTPPPSSKCRHYAGPPRKCLDCNLMVDPPRLRCAPCATEVKRRQTVNAQRLRRAAKRQAAA